jgi:hypothetical protein
VGRAISMSITDSLPLAFESRLAQDIVNARRRARQRTFSEFRATDAT